MIYFIQSGRGDFVKIGFCAGDPQARLGQLQVGNPEALSLVATKEGGKDAEAQWHERFAHLRVRGEWFKWDEELRDHARPLLKCPDAERLRRQQSIRDFVAATPQGEINRAYDRLLGAPILHQGEASNG